MASSLEKPVLYVEGQSDLHIILQLLARHNIQLDKATGPVVVKDTQGDSGVLGAMTTATKASTGRPVGFVLDADRSLPDRWKSVCAKLSDLGLSLPGSIPRDGYIGESTRSRTLVGVWIMPDNGSETGNLETFIQTLVSAEDSLFDLAKTSTRCAREHGAGFKDQDQVKADLHCWLAWQKEPGLSLGTAIKVKYLGHDSDVAQRFVAWFRHLFDGSLSNDV